MGAGRGKCLWMPGAASAQHLTCPAALPCPGCQRGREVTPEPAPGQQRGRAASSSHRGMPLCVPHSLCHRSLRLRASHHPSPSCSLRELCGSSGRALPSGSITGRESRLLRLGKGMPTSDPPCNSWDKPSQHHSRTPLGTEGFSPHSPRSRQRSPGSAPPRGRGRRASGSGTRGNRPAPGAAPAAGGTAGWLSAARTSGRTRRPGAAPWKHPRPATAASWSR